MCKLQSPKKFYNIGPSYFKRTTSLENAVAVE